MAPIHRNICPKDVPDDFKSQPAAWLSTLFAQGGNGTRVYLAQDSLWELEGTISVRVDDAELATEGYPKDPKKQAKLYTTGNNVSMAVNGNDTRHFKLSHVYIDGRRPQCGYIEGGHALVSVGGPPAVCPTVEYCHLMHPRGWSCLHVFDFCEGARIIGNKAGPSGMPAPEGPWADGLSIACRNGLIANNEIVDATDGAIVLFCAPGTICVGNTIIARERNCLGAINMVDPFPYQTDYKDTRVFNNTIRTEGSGYIKLGIGIGETCWSPQHQVTISGGFVQDNIFGPGSFGYAIAASGCKDFIVTGNRVAEGARFEGDMSNLPEPLNAPPMPFLRNVESDWAQGEFQEDFVRGRARWLIGIEQGASSRLRYDAGQLRIKAGPHHALKLRHVSIILWPHGNLSIVSNKSQKVVWHSCSGGHHVQDPVLELSKHGKFQIKDRNGEGDVIWDPTAYLAQCEANDNLPDRFKAREGDMAGATVSDAQPYFILWSSTNDVLWATHYEFPKGGLEIPAGGFIAMPASQPQFSEDKDDQPATGAPAPAVQYQTRPSRRLSAGGVVGGIMNRLGRNVEQQLQLHGSHHQPASSSAPIPSLPSPTSGGETITGPATFLFLDPATSFLLLHRGTGPTKPGDSVAWSSGLFGDYQNPVPSREGFESSCPFQGDGNLVTYGNPDDSKPEERRALWASGTDLVTARLKIVGVDSNGPALEFVGPEGQLIRRFP